MCGRHIYSCFICYSIIIIVFSRTGQEVSDIHVQHKVNTFVVPGRTEGQETDGK